MNYVGRYGVADLLIEFYIFTKRVNFAPKYIIIFNEFKLNQSISNQYLSIFFIKMFILYIGKLTTLAFDF